jgi:hypothetical protein
MANLGESRYLYNHITTAATTNVHQTGPVLLHSITINDAMAGTATVIDGTAATDAARATVAVIDANVETTLKYNVELSKGLIIVTDATSDLTVSYVTI